MSGNPRIKSNEQAAAALRGTKGMVALAARNLGVTRQALYSRIMKSPALQQVLKDEREITTDAVEMKLYEAILSGDVGAMKFYLATQGRNRGYAERVEHTGADGGPVEIRTITAIVTAERDDVLPDPTYVELAMPAEQDESA